MDPYFKEIAKIPMFSSIYFFLLFALLTFGGSRFRRTNNVCEIKFEKRGPIATNSNNLKAYNITRTINTQYITSFASQRVTIVLVVYKGLFNSTVT